MYSFVAWYCFAFVSHADRPVFFFFYTVGRVTVVLGFDMVSVLLYIFLANTVYCIRRRSIVVQVFVVEQSTFEFVEQLIAFINSPCVYLYM